MKKVCYKVSFCESCQRQSCKAFTGLLFVRDVPYYMKIWPKLTNPLQNASFQSIFVCSASAIAPGKKVQLTRI